MAGVKNAFFPKCCLIALNFDSESITVYICLAFTQSDLKNGILTYKIPQQELEWPICHVLWLTLSVYIIFISKEALT